MYRLIQIWTMHARLSVQIEVRCFNTSHSNFQSLKILVLQAADCWDTKLLQEYMEEIVRFMLLVID